mmetsp:Transcript_34495/g.42542  ORF Transcript_34495/g.42542 Transcript_34495/m.42542 type:complete len:95 (-) Transcript_34495:596-880(-)
MQATKKKSKKEGRKGSVPQPELQDEVEAGNGNGNLNQEVRFSQTVVKRGLRNVASHHIESFDYTMQKCLPRICSYMLPVEVLGGSDAPAGAAAA